MTKRGYSFYDHTPTGSSRSLPIPPRKEAAHGRLSAGISPLLSGEEAAAAEAAEDILLRLCSEVGREISKKSATPFDALYGVFAEFCREREDVLVIPADPHKRFPTVAVCAHNLFFCLSGVLRAAKRRGTKITLTGARDGEGAAFVLSTDRPALLDKEVEELFGLSPQERITMQKIGEVSSFSFRYLPGDNASLLFSLPPYRAETFMVYSKDRLDSLRLAIDLAAHYFA